MKYEKSNYLQQIRTSRNIDVLYDKIDLVPEGTFFKEAPANLTEVKEQDSHKVMLNRLAYELQERKRLCTQLDELKGKKESLLASNEKTQDFLGGLFAQLKGLDEAAMSIQEHLKAPPSNEVTSDARTTLLPRYPFPCH